MPAQPDMNGIKASLAFWLYLTTNPSWNAYNPNLNPPSLAPVANTWSTAALPQNIAALEAGGNRGHVQKMLDYLVSTPSKTAPNLTMWDHFRGVQAAFQDLMGAQNNVLGAPSPYPVDDPDCPGSPLWVTQLGLTYPTNFNPGA
jgi:hypothetical protein